MNPNKKIKIKHPVEELFIKSGDTIDFIALEWIEPQWEFDYPSILLNPVIKLYTDASPAWYVIENAIEEIITIPELNCPKITSEDIKWTQDFYGWDINIFKRIAYNLLRGEKDGIKRRFKILHEKVLFVEDEESSGYLKHIFL